MPKGSVWWGVGAAGAAVLVAAGSWGLYELDASPRPSSDSKPSAAARPSPSPSPTPSPKKKFIHTHLPTRVTQVEGEPSYGSPSSPPDDAEVLRLDDGLRVALYYDEGTGLVEQRHSPRAGAWSKPRTLYATRTEPCPDITLKRFGGTVAAIANFARFCSDGEPPVETIAAVGTRDLSTWDIHLTERFDGWEKITASDDAAKVTFAYAYTSPPGVTRLEWREGQGFSQLLETPKDPAS